MGYIQDRTEQKLEERRQADMLSAIVIFGVIALGLIICFVPGIIMTKLLRKWVGGIKAGPKTSNVPWIEAWSALCQVSVYVAGAFAFRNIFFVSSKHHLISDFWHRFITVSTYEVPYAIFFCVSLPLLLLVMIKIADHYRDLESVDEVYVPRLITPYLGLFIISVFFYPFSFIYFGLRAKKVSWFMTGIVHINCFIAAVGFMTKFPDNSVGKYCALAVGTYYIMSLVNTFLIRKEYLSRIKYKRAIHIVNEAA